MHQRKMILLGGGGFIVGALAFVAVFSYLAANFDYPTVLDGTAAEVLPRLRNGGSVMRTVWAVYSFLPLFLIPGAVGAHYACPASQPRMTLALIFASIGALAMCLGLMRWPSIHWSLAGAYESGGTDAKHSLDAVFLGLNLYLGNYIGEFLGETALAAFFLLSSLSMRDEERFPRWISAVGVIFSALFFVGAFRNVTSKVQSVADLNNSLLPLWMITLGATLMWYAGRQRPREPVTSEKVPKST